MVDRPPLTARQSRILEVIRDSVRDRGYPPTLRELTAAVGISSSSTASEQLRLLAARGYIRLSPNTPRGIMLLDDTEPVSLEVALRRIGLSYHDRFGHRTASLCPPCGKDLAVVGLTQLAYTFETCACGSPEHPHLIQQLWHRSCLTTSGTP